MLAEVNFKDPFVAGADRHRFDAQFARATAELLIAFFADELEAQLVSAPPRFGVFSIDSGLGNEFCVEDDVPCRIKAVLQNAEYPFLGVGEIWEVLSDREIEIH